jgi:hypothetical protein
MPRSAALFFVLFGVVVAIALVAVPLQAAPQSLNATLSVDAPQPAAGQRVHYTLNVSNPGVTTTFTATLNLPASLLIQPASTFGGAIYLSDTHHLAWNATLGAGRSLRAGFDAATWDTPNTMLTVTASITDGAGAHYTSSIAITVRNGPALEPRFFANPAGAASGQPFTLIYQVWNRSISDTTFALTTTLPAEAQFVGAPYSGTITYNDPARTLNWQRTLKADRAVLAAAVISATRSGDHTIAFVTAFNTGTVTEWITRIMLDPIQTFLPLITKNSGSATSYLVTPIDHPFERRGTPPGSIDNMAPPSVCQQCHVYTETNIYASWASSAHGYGAIDPVFNAALFNAKRQVKDVERWCTQCHRPENWLQGHPLDEQNRSGITCSTCHRAVAPDSTDADNDQATIDRAQSMELIPPRWRELGGSGALLADQNDLRRGTNFLNLGAPHNVGQSEYQGESALCGSCHSVYALHLAPDALTGEYTLGRPDIADGENPFFLQSTYPEWLHSQYPAQDKQCQDCHMPRKQGYVALPGVANAMERLVPMHTFAGGNLFILDIFDQLGGMINTSDARVAVTNMLTQSAAITPAINGGTLDVDVTCLSGHKCPTGYEEGRAWILQVEQLDGSGQRIACSGCWDEAKHTISGYAAGPTDPGYDPELTEFAVHFGITGTHALQLGMTSGPSFNLALNNTVLSDTRIPPCGWDAAAYQSLGIAPTVPYASGSCTATAHYAIQPGAQQIVVRVLHWSHTTPYLEFLRDVGGDFGQTVWQAWQANLSAGKGRPFVITSQAVNVP